MALIKLFFGELELDYKKETLSLKKENNAFSSDFTVAYSSFPFLIIENDKALQALGSADITSIHKKKIIPITVLSFGVKYYGELQQLSVIKGFRKCNLKYSSDLLKIMSKKLSEYMPVVSVIPTETDPKPFKDVDNKGVADDLNWQNYPVPFIGKFFPEVKWQFPTMDWKDKYGTNLGSEDPWAKYEGKINGFFKNASGQTVFRTNTFFLSENRLVVNNYNVASPQVFLLSPLHYIAKTIGYSYTGNFVSNELIKRILFLSEKDNIVNAPFQIKDWSNEVLGQLVGVGAVGDRSYRNLDVEKFVFKTPGKHTFKLKFTEPKVRKTFSTFGSYETARFEIWYDSSLLWRYIHAQGTPLTVYETTLSLDVKDLDIGKPLVMVYQTSIKSYPSYEIKYRIDSFGASQKLMHPTIETGRYVPDWTVGSYFNYLKNQFNLDITVDDFKKEISINLNESIDDTEVPVVVANSLALKSYELAANSSFIVKSSNPEDAALYIDGQGAVAYTNQGDDFTQKIQSEFKLVPHNGLTSELSSALEERSGVGLLLYDTLTAPYTSSQYNGFSLSIDGTAGIYQTFWKRSIRFLLNASNCQLKGYFTEIEIARIYEAKSVYIDNQRYRIVYIELSEATNNYSELLMELRSVNY